MKRLLTCSVIAMAASAGAASAQDISACLITKTDTNPFFVKMREGATAKANELGITLNSYAGKVDVDNEAQVAAIETCIANGAKGILIALVVLGHNRVLSAASPELFSSLYNFHVGSFLLLPFFAAGKGFGRSWLADRAVRYLVPHLVFFAFACAAFAAGVVLFSGSLYALCLSGLAVLGAVTPLGGLAFIAGWAALGTLALRPD